MSIPAVVLGIVLSSAFAYATVDAQAPSAAVQEHIARAKQLADPRYSTAMQRMCAPAQERRPVGDYPNTRLAPVRVFDNLYFVGLGNVYAWAVSTPDGIIMLDSLNNASDAEFIVGGLKTLGLDPAGIKYVVVTHSHADHFGGAPYLQERFGAKVIASEIEWEAMAKMSNAPKRDIAVNDGETITLGGTTLTFIHTPGHTPGAMSVIVPVADRGQRHVAALLNGTATNTPDILVQSMERLAARAKAAHVDVEINNHSFIDDSLPILDRVRTRTATDPHPLVIGEEGYQRFSGWLTECLRADIARRGGQ